MGDLFLDWGSDLVLGASGDLRLADERQQINQRIIRRLLTNPGDDIWNLSFGGGLPLAVGNPIDRSRIEAIVRQQLAMDTSVQNVPAPLVNVGPVDAARGAFAVEISYSSKSGAGTAAVTVS